MTYLTYFLYLWKVCFYMNNSTMRQIFKLKNGTCQNLMKLFKKMCRLLKKNCSIKTTFWIMLLHKSDSFCVFPISKKHHLESRFLQCVILGMKKLRRANCFVQIFYNASEFELRPIQRFRKRNEKFKTFQKLRKCFQKFPFWNILQRKNDIISLFCALHRKAWL